MQDRKQIDYWDCVGCSLSELNAVEADRHEQLTDHTVIPRYV